MVEILLASHGEGLFLFEQIQSICEQTYQDWKLTIRHDGPKGKELYLKLHPILEKESRISFLFEEEALHAEGVNFNFEKMLKNSSAEFIMFCDSDDVWDKNKIATTLQFLQKKLLDQLGPIAVFSDTRIVDQYLNIRAPSYWKQAKINPLKTNIKSLLVENIATGHTMMINRDLKNYVLPFPKDIPIFDWWIALVASSFSALYPLEQVLGSYRQHSHNLIGARRLKLRKNFWSMNFYQAEELIKRLSYYNKDNSDLKEFLNIQKLNCLKAPLQLIQMGHKKNSQLKNFLLLLTLSLHQAKFL